MAAEPKPRLLYLVTSLNAGGAEWGLVTLVREGGFAGFDVTVAALVRGAGAQVAALRELGHPPLILEDQSRLTPLSLLRAAFRLHRLLRRLRPAVMVLSLPHANLLGRVLRPSRRRPLVVSFEHNSRLARGFYEVGYRATSGRVDRALADCDATATAAFGRLYRRPPSAFDVLPLAAFAPDRCAEPLHRPLPGAPFHLLSAARLTPPKDQGRLVALLAALRGEGLDVRLTICGEGPLRAELAAAAERLGVAAHLSLPGHTPGWWRTPAHLFVLTSRHEGLCIAVLEAMAAGLPVAATPVGGLNDYGAAAGVVTLDLQDPSTDAARIVAVLQDEARRGAMTVAGRTMVSERLGETVVRTRYAEFNSRLLAAAMLRSR